MRRFQTTVLHGQRILSYSRAQRLSQIPKFAMPSAVYSTASLRDDNAQPYKTMTGKLDASLLTGLQSMGFEYMTPVQNKVLTELPTFRTDCLVQAKTGMNILCQNDSCQILSFLH